MSKGRKGGNPALAEYRFKTSRAEPLRHLLQVRVTERTLSALKDLGAAKADFIRAAVEAALAKHQGDPDLRGSSDTLAPTLHADGSCANTPVP